MGFWESLLQSAQGAGDTALSGLGWGAETLVGDPLLRAGSQWRYGMSPEEKQSFLYSGATPTSEINPARPPAIASPEEERRTSAYLFGREHPYLAQVAQPVVNELRAYNPMFGPPNPFSDRREDVDVLRQAAEEASPAGIQEGLNRPKDTESWNFLGDWWR